VPRSSTTWEKGQSGNPDGKAHQPSLRKAIREALSEIDPKSKSKTYYQSWARSLRDGAISNEQKIEIAKFLEGATPLIKPSNEDLEDSQAHDSDGNPVEP
jgi:Family of unknown function (DUF5681)